MSLKNTIDLIPTQVEEKQKLYLNMYTAQLSLINKGVEEKQKLYLNSVIEELNCLFASLKRNKSCI